MSENVKSELAKRALFRAKSGLYLLQNVVLPHIRGGTDAAYSRSAYILLSFNAELVLSALFILGSKKTTESEVIQDLISASKSHNLANLFDGTSKEHRFGIQSVVRKDSNGFVQYDIKFGDSTITIEDLTDVRYDFKKNTLRTVNENEGAELRSSVAVLLELVRSVIDKSIDLRSHKEHE